MYCDSVYMYVCMCMCMWVLQDFLVYRAALMCAQFPMLSAPSPPEGASPTPTPPILPFSSLSSTSNPPLAATDPSHHTTTPSSDLSHTGPGSDFSHIAPHFDRGQVNYMYMNISPLNRYMQYMYMYM